MKELVLIDNYRRGYVFPPHIENVAKVLDEVMARNEWEIHDLDRAIGYLKTVRDYDIRERIIREKLQECSEQATKDE